MKFTSVEDLVERLETLLACGIPNLQLNDLVIDLEEESSKLDSDCDFVLLFELVFSQSHQKRAFSNAYSKR